jgi:hypothetical protein
LIRSAFQLPHACELAKEEYREWADGLFPSLSCVHDEYRDWAIGNELMYLEQEGVPMPTRVPVPPASVAEPAAEETPLEKLKAWLQGIKERRLSQTQSASQILHPKPAPHTPAQQQRPSSRLEPSPVFENSSPAQLTQRSPKMTPDQTPRSPQPSPEFVQARTALAHCYDEAVTQEEARSAAASLRAILGSEPGSASTSQLTPRRFPDLFGRPSDPEPEPESESESEPVLIPRPQQPARRRRRRRRGRRGRRSDKEAGTAKLAESCLTEDEEPDACFSPDRRFDEKERRERPPRRYDK